MKGVGGERRDGGGNLMKTENGVRDERRGSDGNLEKGVGGRETDEVGWKRILLDVPMCAMNMSLRSVDSRLTLQSKFKPPGAMPPCSSTTCNGSQ